MNAARTDAASPAGAGREKIRFASRRYLAVPSAMAPRILFTGGSGKAGRHVVASLTGRGYEVINFDLAPPRDSTVPTLLGDITRSGRS